MYALVQVKGNCHSVLIQHVNFVKSVSVELSCFAGLTFYLVR